MQGQEIKEPKGNPYVTPYNRLNMYMIEYEYMSQQCYLLHHCTAHSSMSFYLKWMLYTYIADVEV